MAAAALLTLAATPVLAQDDQRSLNLIDIHLGSPLSETVQALSEGGYELSDGTYVDFGPWYQTYWHDLSLEWLLQLGPDDGLLWGFSTGEHGEKYRIDPAVKLGFITQSHPRSNSTLSLTLTTTLWGHLTEYPCTADYGNLGTYTVNCRLAASEIAPEDTLAYLLDEDPSRLTISLSYFVNF